MKFLFMLLCLGSLVSYSSCSSDQTRINSAEITSNIPELSDFHEIIYPLWHDAYPAKDYAKLKGFVPQIKASVKSINKAKLPGILRDKEAQWESRLEELNTISNNYYKAADSNDNDALMAAAEKLHRIYEQMNRLIRPLTKEIDKYHQTLYIIYHKLYPEAKYDEIALLTGTFISKAEAIMNSSRESLKQRLGEDLNRYDVSAKKLHSLTLALKEAMDANDVKKKDAAVQAVHRAYQDLESVFD